MGRQRGCVAAESGGPPHAGVGVHGQGLVAGAFGQVGEPPVGVGGVSVAGQGEGGGGVAVGEGEVGAGDGDLGQGGRGVVGARVEDVQASFRGAGGGDRAVHVFDDGDGVA